MKRSTSIWTAGLAAAVVMGSAASAQPARVHLDEETVLGGIGVACTGIGQTKNDPKWQAYDVRIEFADQKANYLAGEVVSLADPRGQALLEATCEGPWVLLKLPPGKSYKVSARVLGGASAPKSAAIKAAAHGQARFVMTFPAAD